MQTLRSLVGFLVLMFLGMILGAALYETVVLVPNYRHDIPNSLEHFRLFMAVANPGHFFRLVAPAAQLSVLVGVILFWKTKPTRWWLIAALAGVVLTDIVTFTFHYPRNDFMFQAPLTRSAADLAVAAEEWARGNLVRVALIAASLICAVVGLKRSVAAAQIA